MNFIEKSKISTPKKCKSTSLEIKSVYTKLDKTKQNSTEKWYIDFVLGSAYVCLIVANYLL